MPLLRTVGATFHTLRKVPFIVWLWIAQLFLLINASAIAPPAEVGTFQTILIIYMLAQLMFFRFAPKVRGLQMNLNQAIPWFVGGLVVTMFVLVGVQGIRGLEVQTYAVSAAVYLIIMHTLVVAVSEELVFRGLLPAIITFVPAQILFGLFHWSAYGGGLWAILIAIIAGFLFYAITRYVNIWAAMGSHAGYNLAVLQIFGVL